MSKLKKFLSIICLAAAFLLLAACADPASSLFPAKTVKFQAGAVEIEGTTDLTITLRAVRPLCSTSCPSCRRPISAAAPASMKFISGRRLTRTSR